MLFQDELVDRAGVWACETIVEARVCGGNARNKVCKNTLEVLNLSIAD